MQMQTLQYGLDEVRDISDPEAQGQVPSVNHT